VICAWTAALWHRYGLERCQILGIDASSPTIARSRPSSLRREAASERHDDEETVSHARPATLSAAMARTWLQIEVELEGGRDIDCQPPPGRVFLVGPSHSFAALAAAIDSAFARWDLSHLHVFELADGRRIGFADVDPDAGWLDNTALKVTRAVEPGALFRYVFDLGDDWRHRCRALPEKVDPRELYGPGPLPRLPVPVWGWGWIPDQYGRVSATEDGLDGG